MAETNAIDKILATRNLLKTTLQNSKSMASALNKTEPKLQQIKKMLPPLEAQVAPCLTKIHKSLEFRKQVELALGPSAAVLKVFDSICQLENLVLTRPVMDGLSSYISATVKLEEALRFLADNCLLAIQWLQGVAEFVTHNRDTVLLNNDKYVFNMKMSLKILQELKRAKEIARIKGGILCITFDRLESVFKATLMDVSLSSRESDFPENVLRKLRSIVERLNASSRLKSIESVFVEVRSLNARKRLQDLDTGYLEKSITESEEFQDFESCIVLWGRHLELALQQVLDYEQRLCKEVFGVISEDVWTNCFADIAKQSGILSVLQFGMSIAESKKDPIKLLNLLQVFAVLDTLRMDFNKLFGGEACVEIRTMTRDVIKKVVDGAADIFLELPSQVVLQRQNPAPADGSIPSLVTFVTNYSNELLGDKYRPILTKVLEIKQMWKNDKYEEELVAEQIYCVVREIAVNLDVWAKSYENASLSYIFMMNNHCHFHGLRGTRLGNMMGDSWLSGHGKYKDYYAALFLKQSWGKLLLPFLNQEKQIPSSPKKRLKEFNEAFEGLCKTQANWVIPDEDLRQKVCQLLVQTLVPDYKSYLLNYTNARVDKYVKYSAGSVENMISAMFRPKILNYGSLRDDTVSVAEMQHVLRNHCNLPLAAS